MANREIRDLILKHRLRHYEVSAQLCVSECTLSRWLRKELSEDKKAEIVEAINKLVAKQA